MVCNILKTNGKKIGFLCGKIKVDACKKCGETENSLVLCDYPIGNGKTCDTILCEKCANRIGEDLHLCDYHYTLYKEILKKDNIKDNLFWLNIKK